MPLFKEKTSVEQEVSRLLTDVHPRAVAFLARENEHAHRPVKLPEQTLLEISASMCLFFLAAHLPEEKPDSKDKMGRAFMQVQQELRGKDADPDKVYSLWKHFTEGLMFKQDADPLTLACKLTWERHYPDRVYKEPSPMRSFAYFLQMEVNDIAKRKLV